MTDPAANFGLLPLISAQATTSQDGDGQWQIAFQAGSPPAPLDLTGISFSLQWHPANGGAPNTVVVSLSAGQYLTNGGSTGILTLRIPQARLRVLPTGTYAASLVASLNGLTSDLGVITVTHTALGSSNVTALSTTARNAASATTVGYVPGPQGASAYQVAVANGYTGSQSQWLASLVGASGATGPAGAQGPQGATGPAGPTGAQGPAGPAGSTGPAGTNGTNGTNGVNGAAWYSGSGAPGTVAGAVNGDWYINTTSGDLYRLISGTWTLQLNITAVSGALHYDTPQSLGLPAQMQALANFNATLIGDRPINLNLAASVASNALTLSIKTTAGADPSAAAPVYIPVRDPTVTNGALVWLPVTSATTLTVPSGATLGAISGQPFRLWLVAFNNAGAAALGVMRATDGTGVIYPLNDGAPASSTAINASSTSAGTIYAGSALTARPYTILGHAEWSSGLTTAGTWATAPTAVRLFGPGVKKPGDLVWTIVGRYASASQGNNNTSSYANIGLYTPFTPTSAVNPVRVRLSGGALYGQSGATSYIRIARSIGATLSAAGTQIAETGNYSNGGLLMTTAPMEDIDFPGVASLLTYGPQLKNGGGGFNVIFPNIGTATLLLEEIQV